VPEVEELWNAIGHDGSETFKAIYVAKAVPVYNIVANVVPNDRHIDIESGSKNTSLLPGDKIIVGPEQHAYTIADPAFEPGTDNTRLRIQGVIAEPHSAGETFYLAVGIGGFNITANAFVMTDKYGVLGNTLTHELLHNFSHDKLSDLTEQAQDNIMYWTMPRTGDLLRCREVENRDGGTDEQWKIITEEMR
jgi:hypothetical protein